MKGFPWSPGPSEWCYKHNRLLTFSRPSPWLKIEYTPVSQNRPASPECRCNGFFLDKVCALCAKQRHSSEMVFASTLYCFGNSSIPNWWLDQSAHQCRNAGDRLPTWESTAGRCGAEATRLCGTAPRTRGSHQLFVPPSLSWGSNATISGVNGRAVTGTGQYYSS